jgi:glycosyltransferase involved in cell wall biosynthesis
MEGIVHFHPIASLGDLPRLLSRMDLEVLANRRSVATELMLPVKMLECVALGIPVVAPELKAIRTYFTDDMIFFFKPDDTESLSEAILLALRNPEMRKQKAASAKRFLAEYGWGTHKERLLDLYRHL